MVTCAFSKPKCCALLKEICLNIKDTYIKNNDPSLWYFSSFQSLSHVRLFVTPWTAALQVSLSITNSRSLLKLMSIKSVMPSNHLVLFRPLLLLPTILPSIRVFLMSQLFASGAKVLELQHQSFQGIFRADFLQDSFKIVLISLLSMRLSRVFSSTTMQKHQFFGAQLSL